MEALIREAERRFRSTGDYIAWTRYCELMLRTGYDDPRNVEAPTEWDEVQEDWDDLWWHRRKALCLDWDGRPINHGALYKAHHEWGHKGFIDTNSKRKTLRTHRDSKHKSRNYQLPKERCSRDVSECARRRRKRFGGREHRYNRRWIQNEQTGRWRIVYDYSHPDLDG